MKYNEEFSARRHNKYSIRKFSVGLASILVGSIFFYGQNVQAAEEQQSDVSSRQSGDGSAVADSPATQAPSQSDDRVDAQVVSSDNSAEVSSSNSNVQQPNAQAVSNTSKPQAVQAPDQPKAPAQAQQNVAQQRQQPVKPVLKQAQIEKKDINTKTKEVDAFKYVDENSQHLTDNERQFFLRSIARETPLHARQWQNLYDKNYNAKSMNVDKRTIKNERVQNVKIITDALQKLVTDRDKDEFYTDLRSDNKAPRTNQYTLSNTINKDKDGKQSLNLQLSKNIVPLTFQQGGKWQPWKHRFEHWGLRTNQSIHNKIDEVRLKYSWNGKQHDDVVTRDKDGFYWFKDNEKHGYKGHLGGAVNFVVKFKKNAVLDKTKDALWGYILSDSDMKNPSAVVNYGFKKFNLGQQNFEKNSMTAH